MSLARIRSLLLILGLVVGIAAGAGCLADEGQPGGKESTTQPSVPDTGGGSGGTPPEAGDTTLPIPIPIGT